MLLQLELDVEQQLDVEHEHHAAMSSATSASSRTSKVSTSNCTSSSCGKRVVMLSPFSVVRTGQAQLLVEAQLQEQLDVLPQLELDVEQQLDVEHELQAAMSSATSVSSSTSKVSASNDAISVVRKGSMVFFTSSRGGSVRRQTPEERPHQRVRRLWSRGPERSGCRPEQDREGRCPPRGHRCRGRARQSSR